ncbi:MAG: PocR ligand-binding domain-containing protein [Methanoregula sp.]|nr:PocR ligand-binding domain-containing protein [Methanoregula sp.]MDD5187100.1 PocR ligand-binding domain-containing protein [Methanoregula sp.]
MLKIKDLLKKDQRGLNIREISEKLKINRNSVAKLLEILTAKEEVEIRVYGKSKVYHLSQQVPLSDLMKFSSNFIIALNHDLRIVQANDAFLHYINIPKSEVLHTWLMDIPTNLFKNSEILPAADTAIKGKENHLEICVKTNPHDTYYKIIFTPALFQDLSRGVILILENITEKKEIENALRNSEEKYRRLTEHTSDILYSLDAEGNITYIGPQISRFGNIQENIISKPFCSLPIFPQDREEIIWNFRQHFSFGGKITNVFRIVDSQGGIIWFESSSISERDETGAVTGIYGVIRDITDRKRAEVALHKSEDQIKKKLDAILSPTGDIGTLDLTDVIDILAIQSLMNDLFSLTQIGIRIIDLHGNVLVATVWQDICTQFHRVHPGTLKNCRECGIIRSGETAPGTFRIYQCKNHMWDIVSPIIVGETHMGNLFLGHFLYDDDPGDYELFRSQARQYGFDEKEYLAALERVPRWNREKIDTIMAFYTKFTGMISTMSHNNIQLARMVTDRDHLLNSLAESEARYRTLVENIPKKSS